MFEVVSGERAVPLIMASRSLHPSEMQRLHLNPKNLSQAFNNYFTTAMRYSSQATR